MILCWPRPMRAASMASVRYDSLRSRDPGTATWWYRAGVAVLCSSAFRPTESGKPMTTAVDVILIAHHSRNVEKETERIVASP